MDTRQTWIYPALAWIQLLCLLTGVTSVRQPQALYGGPHVKSTQARFNFSVGQTARLHCIVDNLGEKQFVWKFAGKPEPLTVGLMMFSEDERLSVRHDGSKRLWTLEISNVRLEDAGLYECLISSQVRHLRDTMTLDVSVSTADSSVGKNIQITGTSFVNEGGIIQLECSANSSRYPQDNIDWYRNGDTLSTDLARGVNISMRYYQRAMQSTLLIRPARLQDQGDYVCRASSKDVVLKRVIVLKDPNRAQGKREIEPGYSMADQEKSKVSFEDKNSGRDVRSHWTTVLSLSLMSLCLVRTNVYCVDCT
ncbi:hypothetical protein EGW08_000997 [Elysia chlorotica]|uniref:Ig-like domain-containing protein n=1 Tax=Elysia chlorotica TaxID=188477 RepID=A0A433UBI6_ELYCH|nr:hypothetical protein EGW08_000997 [Elysia chlorotica]